MTTDFIYLQNYILPHEQTSKKNKINHSFQIYKYLKTFKINNIELKFTLRTENDSKIKFLNLKIRN